VYAVDATIFNRPGPRVGQVARRIAEILHPGALAADSAARGMPPARTETARTETARPVGSAPEAAP